MGLFVREAMSEGGGGGGNGVKWKWNERLDERFVSVGNC